MSHPNLRMEHDLEMKARDGVVLRADVIRPDIQAKVPAIVARTPYEKTNTLLTHRYLPPVLAAQRGFAGVPEAFTFAFGLPPILGLAPTGGFQFMLEDRAGSDIGLCALPRRARAYRNTARRG